MTLENLKCKHIRIEKVSEINKCIGSKYIQSNAKKIYNSIKLDLKENVPVLFVGTPCQCRALNNIVGKKENLYIVDFICHGVCSQELFDRSIKLYEKQNNCKVIDFSFRYKTNETLRNYKLKYLDKDGIICSEIKSPIDFPYYNAFLNHYSFRNCCYTCNFKTINRVSDITLGDFWGIEKIDKNINDEKLGYSAMLLNTSKGTVIFSEIKSQLVVKEIPIEYLIENNYALTNKDNRPLISFFFEILFKLDIKLLSDLFLTSNPSLIGRVFRWLCNKVDLK